MIDLQTIQQCTQDVHPTTIMRIMTVETRKNPYSIGFRIVKNKQNYYIPNQPKNLAQAKYMATWLYNKGYAFDAGIAQINSSNFARFGVQPEHMFDVCTNIHVAGKILKEFYLKAKQNISNDQQALQAAISGYNSGKFNSNLGRQYVAKVMQVHIQP
jgi:type IV secretion system protein VirB1